jgi:hypothetical protein
MATMGSVDDERPTGVPGERRPERQLERPPSDRYRDDAEPRPADEAPTAGPRGIVGAIVAALVGAIAIAVGGGLMTITAGLLVIAAVLGWVVAALVSLDADPAAGRRGRRTTATIVGLAGVALGQVGLWIIAREEGGTLGPIDYLAEVFGVLVPLEFALAGGIAWWRTA